MTPEGLAMVKSFEGCRLAAYQDIAGIWTIGYGHTVGVQDGDAITQDQADLMLDDELNRYRAQVLMLCHVEPTDHQADAMASFAYNEGVGAFKGSSLLVRHNFSDFAGAADAFLPWNRAHVGGQLVVVPGLSRRREAERVLYLTP